MPRTIYFVRHGESQANLEGIIAGSSIDSPLTKKGISQAKKVAQNFINKKIDLIVSSPLKRASKTARIIASIIAYPEEKILISRYFQERDLGEFVGMPEKEAWGLYHKKVKQNLSINMEDDKAFFERLKQGFDWLEGQAWQKVIVVSHAGAGRMFRVVAEKLHHSHFYKLDESDNAAAYKISLESTRMEGK